MRIVDAEWGPKINTLVLECDCGAAVRHRADRWKVRCRRCGATEHLQKLRARYVDSRERWAGWNADRVRR